MLTLLSSSPNIVMIYVDNPHKIFKVRRSGLDASPLLSRLLTHHPENGWYIMSPKLSSLDAENFRPIVEYIDRREYHPNILDDHTPHVRLEGDLSPEMLRHEVVRCGTIYQVAQMLEMPGLQDLVFRKLKALTPVYEALEMLTVIELLFDIGSPEIRQYLTQHVADHYWTLVLAETEKTVEVMTTNKELMRGVFGKLSGKEDDGEIKVETVKEEGKEGAKKEEGLGGESKKEEVDEANSEAKGDVAKEGSMVDEANNEANGDGAKEGSMVDGDKEGAGNRANNASTNTKEKTDEAITQTEEEMVKMALRRSDCEQTEEDWVQLVQKQSDLFEAF